MCILLSKYGQIWEREIGDGKPDSVRTYDVKRTEEAQGERETGETELDGRGGHEKLAAKPPEQPPDAPDIPGETQEHACDQKPVP